MSEISVAQFRPVCRLAFVSSDSQSILLSGHGASLEIRALAPDLFRLRVAPGEAFSKRPSWAVHKTEWSPLPVTIRKSKRAAEVRTPAAALRIDLESGAWRLADSAGNVLFTAASGGMGFREAAARLNLKLIEQESLFGLGETTGTFNKRGLIREFWNIDVLAHAKAIHPSLRNLYVSIPFAISLRDGRAAGLFWDNPAKQIWDLGQTRFDLWQMTAAFGEIDLYLFAGPTAANVVERFTELTGRMPLPPKWALGYQQCRYGYETRPRVEEVARTFRRKRIPCDVIYLDIHHMDGYRVFTFGKAFPRPAQLIEQLTRRGFKVVMIVDPGVKDDPHFGVLKRGLAAWAFVKDSRKKQDYVGEVWPGPSRFPDFLNESARRWWGSEQARLQKLGVAGFWNDMNEPANFALSGKTLPENCLHETDYGPMLHAEAHNLYGMQMARASREGALAYDPDERPFIITRAGYAGVQRYALLWTGDNSSVW